MAITFDGRVAIVTGAGRGIGKAYALELARRGASVVVNDIGGDRLGRNGSPEPAESVVREIVEAGGDAVASHHSVADESEAQEIVGLALRAFGCLDILINNAGTFQTGRFGSSPLSDFKDALSVHLLGAAYVTHAAWPILQKRGYGRIVMTTSTAGLWGQDATPGYCAGKAGVIGLAKGLALEGRADNILVNLIAPGAKTRASEALFAGRGGYTWRAELVTPAALYLASEACRHSGAIFSALAGEFARVEPVRGRGKAFDPRREVTLEDFVGALDEIESLEGATPLDQAISSEIRRAGRAAQGKA